MLQHLPGATVTFVGEAAGEVRTDNGLLDGLSATTHWAAYDELRRLGAEPPVAGRSSTSAAGS